ncbi:putative ankyrin repeat-containing domain, PGG domain-containing protein [Rosa chinensis]|uniref:Putative ankyrin repeat-containing domain, PGG domain-containing protein n=1 Tax=Rosa chinensis TaxID=74649 RepID=A0A2P6Q1F6_ROSCH|nr:ankyrin repeat-containing protein BDA1 [Rosa chinensis]PRQ28013.1 putative ankyrin repeat-containing domain, PGG domain-containing protein [Rosa chinensis]
MEEELHQAALKGSVPALLELLRQHPHILNGTPSLSDTPLHVAAILGHSAFAAELLTRSPELASRLNLQGSSPLHLAAAKGCVEIVKSLVLVNADLGLVWDRDGLTPLHLGVIKGRVGVVAELARVRPEAARVLTQGGESGFHLCVKHHRFEVLKVLVGCVGKDDDFVNWRDGDGNTVLHVAVAKKQLEVINYLLDNTKIEVNAQNSNGFTALDVLSHSTRDLRDLEIKESLQYSGASKFIKKAPSVMFDQDTVQVPTTMQPLMSKRRSLRQLVFKPKQKEVDWLGRKRSSLMVVASLIATVAFQSAINPPGAVWQSDYLEDSNGNPVDKPHHAGQSVMADTEPSLYGLYMISNTLAFLSSLSIILLLVSGLPMKRRRWMWIQMVIMWVAITALTATYFIGLIFMTPQQQKGGYLYHVTQVSVLVWMALMGIVFFGNVVRAARWLLRKYGCMKKKPRDDSLDEDYDIDDL